AELDMPLSVFLPKFDAFLSRHCAKEGIAVEDVDMATYFSDGLVHLARKMQTLGFLGRHGHVVNVLDYMLWFPAKDVTLLWIPKNSCTSIKASLLKFEPEAVQAKIRPERFHETVEKNFGVPLKTFVDDTFGPLTVLIRHPFERLVSCYIDKFVKPVKSGEPFEEFVYGHIKAAQRHLWLFGRNLELSLSFAEFVDYTLVSPPWTLDAHWRPQADFLCGLADRPGTRLVRSNNFVRLAEMMGVASLGERRNATSGGRFLDGERVSGWASSILPNDLALEEIETYNAFFSETLLARTKAAYAEDLKLFERAA
ncbi:MAG: sulfotransferase family 2 domain-containing protein, partial [Pseudomonadota bacterium]